MRTLVGAADPDPRGTGPAVSWLSNTMMTTIAEFVPVGATLSWPSWPTCGGPMPEPEPYRTTAWVDRRPELVSGESRVAPDSA